MDLFECGISEVVSHTHEKNYSSRKKTFCFYLHFVRWASDYWQFICTYTLLSLATSQVCSCYADELNGFPGELMSLLRQHGPVLEPEVRMTLCRGLILMRNKEFLKPQRYSETLELVNGRHFHLGLQNYHMLVKGRYFHFLSG